MASGEALAWPRQMEILTKQITMAEKITTPIPDLNTAWEDYGGEQVEAFLKNRLIGLTNRKIGDWHLVNGEDGIATLYGFADVDTKEQWQQYIEAGNTDAAAQLVLSSVSFYSQPVQDDYTLAARITKNLDSPMVMGAENLLKFTYNCYYGGDPTDVDTQPGYARFTVNGTQIAALNMTLAPGSTENSVDLGPYLTQENNTVKLEIGNQHGKSRTWTFTIRALEIVLYLDSSYVESLVRQNDWRLRVGCRGVTAMVHLLIDGSEVATSTITNSTYDFPVDVSDTLGAGPHKIELYAENNTYGLRSETITTYFIKAGLSTPSICVGKDADKRVTLYGTASIPYFFHYPYAPAGSTATVNFEIRNTSGHVLAQCGHQTITINNDGTSGPQEWRVTLGDNQYLALGEIVVAVILNSVEATHKIEILDAGVNLEPASECKVYLSAAGRTNADSDAENWHSEYNGETTCTVERSPNFKLTGENGFGQDRYLIKSGKSIRLAGYYPFAQDFGVNANSAANRTGKTFEFEFKTLNCTNSDAKIIECLNNGVGFVIYANRVELHSAAGILETRYSDEEKVRIGFCIDGTTTHCVNKLVDGTLESDANIAYIYVNGVIVRMINYDAATWRQPTAQNIVIGSSDCDIELYTLRIYDKSLNYQQMLNNFAFDTPELEEKIAIAKRNNVLDSTNAVDFAKVLAAMPNTPYKIWEIDRMPTGKKDWVKANTQFVNPTWTPGDNACASFDCQQHDIALDGTSSLSYPDPYKNWANKYNGPWTIHLGDTDLVITKYSITPGVEAAEKEFVDKVNFASSEGISNILAMNAYQKILLGASAQYPGLLTPQQAKQQAEGQNITFRHSLSGFPEIGWLRTYNNGTPSVRFLSLFNFINNKYSPSIFGFDKSGEAEIWEVDDNINFFMDELPEGTYNADTKTWDCLATTLYYARVPKSSPVTDEDYGTAANANQVTQANEENYWLRRFHNWIVSCNPHVAERYRLRYSSYANLPLPITYGDTTYRQDTPEYRLAKLRAEYTDYMSRESVLFYLNFCDNDLCTDSFDKNMSIALVRLVANGPKIAFIFLRDTDTSKMFNNRGPLAFRFYHEWGDSYDPTTGETGTVAGETWDPETQTYNVLCTAGTPVYNGRLSGLFDCANMAWPNERRAMYQAMRSAGLNAADMLAMYNDFWNQWSEALYNNDGMGYANTGRFDMAYGDKREIYKYFYKYRQRYMDSKFNANTSQALELRLWGPGAGVALRHYCPIYAALNWGAGDIKTVRSLVPGEPAYFPSSGNNNTETTFTVYDADLLTKITTYVDMPDGTKVESGLQAISTSLDVTGLEFCKRLKELVLDYSGKAANTNLSNRVTNVGASKALQKLIIRNCPNVTGSFNLQSEQIQEIDLRDTAASGLTVPETESLVSVRLGASMRALTLNGMGNLETLTLQGHSLLTKMDINDCPKASTRELLESILSDDSNVLSDVKLRGVMWSDFSAQYLEKLTDMKLANPDNELTGEITVVGNVSFELKAKLIRAWGDVDGAGTLKINYTKRSLTGAQILGNIYMGEAGKDYQLRIQPDPASANRFTSVKWYISNTTYATINEDSGVVHVKAIGEEANRPSATVTCEITTDTGEVITATQVIGFYVRSCKVGDYVFYDGTFSDVLDGGKTVVGICFYINPADKTQRLCMALSNQSGSTPWGLYPDSSNGANGFAGITLVDHPNYSCFDIPTIANIGSPGVANNYVNQDTYRDESTAGDPDGFKYLTGAAGSIGFTTTPEAIGGYTKDGVIPIGQLNTLRIIQHCDLILNDPALDDLPVPTDEGAGLFQAVVNSINNANTIAPKYRQFYYPAASLCNAYQPGVKTTETLAPCFRQGKWFLPAGGDLCRMYWLHRQGYTFTEDGERPPLMNAVVNGILTALSNAVYWSSTENSQGFAWYVNFSSGNVYYGGKYAGYAVRAVAAF